MLGRTISHYRIVSQLGAGGMGVVYQAEDLRLERPVALKFLSEDLATDRQAVDRLRREARAASALNHPNICTIYDIDESDGQPFIAMELMRGQSLRDRLHGGALKVHQVVDIGIQIADALDAAHSSGIVHRDIKPANIFITDRGQVKVLDFGLAKLTPHPSRNGSTTGPDLTHAGLTLGTIAYMSPEQVSGEDLDGRSDLFSLGDVLYECLTGRQPFTGKSSTAILAAILNHAPVSPIVFNPELPQRLQDVISNCLEKDRELRYQSAADLRADLKRVRRDIDSGHSAALGARSSPDSAGAAPTPRSGRAAFPRDQHAPDTIGHGAPMTSNLLIAAAAIGAIAVVVALIYFLRLSRLESVDATPPTPPVTAPAAAPSAAPSEDDRLQRPLALARENLEARNYRAALAYAGEALTVAPNDAQAQAVQQAAQAELARFDDLIADARRRTAGGDVTGAARALETARRIDPTAPVLVDLSARLSDQVRQAEQTRQKEPAGAARPAPNEPPPADRNTQPTPPPTGPAKDQPPPAVTQLPPPPAPSVTPDTADASPPAAPPAAPAPPPAATTATQNPARTTETPSGPSKADDEAAIRRIVEIYARAIETKDLKLFRSIKPNLSGEEERRLQVGFSNVQSQQVNATVLNIDLKGADAVVLLRRRDTIRAGGRQQTAESQQTLNLSRASGTWVIINIR